MDRVEAAIKIISCGFSMESVFCPVDSGVVSSRDYLSHEFDIEVHYPDELLHFRKLKWPTSSGNFVNVEHAICELLVNRGIVQGEVDYCKEYPWKYFDFPRERSPYDKRCVAIKQFLSEKGFRYSAVHKELQRTQFRGFPDICEFENGQFVRCWEVKSPGDQINSSQKNTWPILKSLEVPINLVNICSDDFKKKRKALNESSRRSWQSFHGTNVFAYLTDKIYSPVAPYFRKGIGINRSRKMEGAHLLDWFKSPYEFESALVRYSDDSSSDRRGERNFYQYHIDLNAEAIIEISTALFHSGCDRWWRVPFVLLEFISDKKLSSSLCRLLEMAYRWECTMKTVHMEPRSSIAYGTNQSRKPIFRPIETTLEEIIYIYQMRVKYNSRSELQPNFRARPNVCKFTFRDLNPL